MKKMITEEKARKREEEAKIQLMREVYESRATHVESMKRYISHNKSWVLQEKQNMENEINIQNQLHEEQKLRSQL